MNKKIYIFLLLISICRLSILAQSPNAEVHLSSLGEEPKFTTVNNVVGYTADEFWLARVATGMKPKFFIERYDNNSLSMKSQKEILIKMGKDEFVPSGAIYFNDQIYAFFYNVSKKDKVKELFLQKINNETLLQEGDPVKLSSIPYINMFKSGYIDFEVSKDKSNLYVIEHPYIDKEDFEKFNVKVYDNQFNIIWEKPIDLPYSNKLFYTENYYVDKTGNFYMLGRLYKDKVVEKRKGEPNYVYKLFQYPADGSGKKEFTAELEGQFITDISFRIANDGNIVCAGFYSDNGSFSIKGTFFMSIDPSTEMIIKKGTKEFGIDFLEQFMSETKAEKKKELYEYDLDDIVLRSDGGALLISEQYYVTTYTSSYSSGGQIYYKTHYVYHYGSIIVVNVNPDFSIAWATRIPKKQVTTDDGGYYSSYACTITPSNIYFVFNDNEKNLLESDLKKLEAMNGKNSVAVLATVSTDGTMTKTKLFSNKDLGVIARPKICEQVSEKSMIVYCEKMKDYIVGRIDFK